MGTGCNLLGLTNYEHMLIINFERRNYKWQGQ
jgi:hypothetical protein